MSAHMPDTYYAARYPTALDPWPRWKHWLVYTALGALICAAVGFGTMSLLVWFGVAPSEPASTDELI